jgi:hypothetical protein
MCARILPVSSSYRLSCKGCRSLSGRYVQVRESSVDGFRNYIPACRGRLSYGVPRGRDTLGTVGGVQEFLGLPCFDFRTVAQSYGSKRPPLRRPSTFIDRVRLSDRACMCSSFEPQAVDWMKARSEREPMRARTRLALDRYYRQVQTQPTWLHAFVNTRQGAQSSPPVHVRDTAAKRVARVEMRS